MFGEPAYRDLCSPLRLSVLVADWRRLEIVCRAINSQWIEDAILKLRDSTPSPIDYRLYDRYDGSQVAYAYNDPFTFCDWHVNKGTLAVVVLMRLIRKMAGV